jgi:cytidylate kinase
VDRVVFSEALHGNAIVDGHIAAFVMGSWADIRILVKCPVEIRAKRIALRENVCLDNAMKMVRERDAANEQHYIKRYGIHISDEKAYTHIIDNSGDLEHLANKVVEALDSIKK